MNKSFRPATSPGVAILSNLPLNRVSGIERFCNYLKQLFEGYGLEVDFFSLEDINDSPLYRIALKCCPILREYYFLPHSLAGRLSLYNFIVTNNYTGGAINTHRHQVYNITHGVYAAGANQFLAIEPELRIPHKRQTLLVEYLSKKKNTPSGIITVSRKVHDDLFHHYGMESTIISNGVDTDHFKKHPDHLAIRKKLGLKPTEFVGLYAGRWNFFEKKLQHLVELIKRRQDIKWLLVTDSKPGLDNLDNVLCLQNISYDKMPEIYSVADFATQLSIYEGCSYFSLESIACSLPVISTKVGGMDAIYNTSALQELIVPVWHNSPQFLQEVEKRIDLLKNNKSFHVATSSTLRARAEDTFSLQQWKERMASYFQLNKQRKGM